MKVRILLQNYRTRYGEHVTKGQIVDIPDERVAEKLIRLRYAERVFEKVETAEVAPPENAALQTDKPRPRGRPRKSPVFD